MTGRAKFNVFIDKDDRFLVIRPIGPLPGSELAARVIEFYRSLEAPWKFDRIVDLRRYEGYIATADLDYAATEWDQMTVGIEYSVKVAMVVRDAYEKLRLPEISERFPQETICYFSDYHEAVGWILAKDDGRYLSGLGDVPVRRREAGAIDIE